ncbi:MAG TPA: response regulator [Verrucomicrobiae bacterium]|nr:response regulator [Verrucomicrobiae bacterium]
MRQNPLILLVEDNEANQILARAVLELEGYEVRVTGSAPAASEELRGCVPDLILMDVQLPGQDGLSFTRVLKSDPATSSIPVVALTAHAMNGDRDQALSAGCVGYISKPIDTRTLGTQVRQFLPAAQ